MVYGINPIGDHVLYRFVKLQLEYTNRFMSFILSQIQEDESIFGRIEASTIKIMC